MIVTELLPARPTSLWLLARQMGIRHAIVKAAPELTGLKPPWDIDSLRAIQHSFKQADLTLYGLEGDQFDMGRIKFGREGRDEDIERYCQMLRNMAELGIHLLCYNFMAGIGWYRTRADVVTRGGALVTEFDARRGTNKPAGAISAEAVWENYRYFIQRVMPVAEKVGVKMALHPDDPPIPLLRGIGRIFITPEAFDRAYAMAPSPSNGVTFCRANFKLLGASSPKTIRSLAESGRLFFLHLREVTGTAEHFREVFHDTAPEALMETLTACYRAGFNGPLRCDHVPTMAGETDGTPGYGTLGRLFANGYLMGLMDALEIPRT